MRESVRIFGVPTKGVHSFFRSLREDKTLLSKSNSQSLRRGTTTDWKSLSKRVNHSKYRILLAPTPFEGVEIYSSVIQARSTLDLGGRETWILVYGWSDVIYSEGKTLPPGAQTHNTYYIDQSFPVKDMVTNKISQVRLQGKLRILAVFFGRWGTGKATLEVQIPCPTDAVNTDCLSPPPVFAGEHNQWTVMPEAPIL